MTKTNNYNLKKPESTDPLRVADFNENSEVIDTALAELAAAKDTLTAAVSKCGNCKIVCGSYAGTGTYDKTNPNTLTFKHKPLLVAIMPKTANDSSVKSLLMVSDSSMAFSYPGFYNSRCTLTWSSKSISWYSNSAAYQFNSSDYTYCYVALLAADE